MRVLLDEQLPVRLARHLSGHGVRTIRQQGWAGLKNGELLRLAADAGFDAFVTADRNLQYQQNAAGLRLGVIVLKAPSIMIEDLLPLLPRLAAALSNGVAPGQVLRLATSDAAGE
jgi:predicted nuclease of predicted toxin-antitoxin system